jgi:hypothetical protein
MPAKLPKKRRTRVTLTRTSEVLDVRMAAELLTVSPDLDLLRLKTYGTIGIMSPIDFLHTLEGFKKAAE